MNSKNTETNKEFELGKAYVVTPYNGAVNGNILIVGNVSGFFGNENGMSEEVANNNLQMFIDAIKSNHKIFIASNSSGLKYYDSLCNELKEQGIITYEHFKNVKKVSIKNNKDKILSEEELLHILQLMKKQKMEFDYIIQNPPYAGSLHLDFLEKGLDLLKPNNGKMVIIEPATWLISLNPNSTYVKGRKDNHTPEIKNRIEGHVESVRIENLNKDFGIKQDVPFATTTIDMSKTFSTIKFICCGEEKEVKSIYDCNLIGDYAMVSGILEKCKSHTDVMDNHYVESKKSSEKENLELYFYPFTDGLLNALGTNSMYMFFSEPNNRVRGFHKCGEFGTQYLECLGKGEITYNIVPIGERGSKYHSVYGTREELENWKHFIFNNKLPLFLNIVLTIDQHNNSKPYLPWLVDKQYTDEEINKMFGFTDEEIALIDKTIKKYERNSPWFKRYMCGPDSVSDEEVNNFINELNKEYA